MGIKTRQKGQRTERLAKILLESEGFVTERQNPPNYIRGVFKHGNKDYFNLFDILAISSTEVKLVQIKSNVGDFYQARKLIKAWLKEQGFKKHIISFEAWVYLGRSKWRRERLNEPKHS